MKKNKFHKLYQVFVKPFILEEIICSVLLGIYSLTSILYPYFLKLIIDDAIGTKDMNKLFVYSILMIAVIIIMVVTRFFQSIKFLKLGQKVTLKLKETILDRLMQYSQTFFRKYKNGEIISILENDVRSVNTLATSMISEMLVNIITAIGLFAILFSMNVQIALYSIFLVVIYTYLQRRYGGRIRNKSMELSKGNGELEAQTQELIYNIDDIKLLNSYKYFKEKFKKSNESYFNKEINLVKLSISAGILGTIFQSVGLLLVLCLGGYMVLQGNMTLGVLFSLTIYIQRIYSPVISLANSYIEIKKTQASINRIYSILDSSSDLLLSGDLELDHNLDGNINLKDLSYGYDDDILVEKSNISIQKSNKVALIGSNGSGKTTLIRLLLKFQQEYTGEILIDGINIKEFKDDYFRNNIICISQNPFIFNGTLLENILIDNQNVSKELIDEVIKMVCLEEDIKKMPNGLDTIIGEKGVAISGGQAQKISLARLFFAKQPIIILDEPTSALDMKAESIICENIYKKLKEKTIIAITHRKAILSYCSKIYEIKNKKIYEKIQNITGRVD